MPTNSPNHYPIQVTPPHAEQAAFLHPSAELHIATENFVRRTIYMGNAALRGAYAAPNHNSAGAETIRATARPVEGTLAAPTVHPSELHSLPAAEISSRLEAVGTRAKASNVGVELYGRKPHTDREQVQATIIASMMQRNKPRPSLTERARNLFRRR